MLIFILLLNDIFIENYDYVYIPVLYETVRKKEFYFSYKCTNETSTNEKTLFCQM